MADLMVMHDFLSLPSTLDVQEKKGKRKLMCTLVLSMVIVAVVSNHC